ncbi:hypothetical protein ACFC5X_00255 [Streptomyces sp. NPDC055952]|uniref:hypothetical protein n=1 Tax=Streptomyces sp. NPDC055952 TaxID=3345663 RepID=UPI0035DAF6EF
MRRHSTTTGAALAAGTLAAGALAAGAPALAPAAHAVTPATATISADCGGFGSGRGTLTATQSGTAVTFTITSAAITAPVSLGKDTVTSTLTLVRAGGGTVAFTGRANPAMAAGAPVEVGPLRGTVAPGDRLEAHGGSLRLTAFGLTATCTAAGPQSPGPFVFD